MDLPLGPTGCKVAAVITGLVGAWFLLCVFSDRLRSLWPRESKIKAGAWSLYAFLWTFAALAEGLDWTTLRSPAMIIAICGFVVILGAAFLDARKNEKA